MGLHMLLVAENTQLAKLSEISYSLVMMLCLQSLVGHCTPWNFSRHHKRRPLRGSGTTEGKLGNMLTVGTERGPGERRWRIKRSKLGDLHISTEEEYVCEAPRAEELRPNVQLHIYEHDSLQELC